MGWTHRMCEKCWQEREGNRMPVHVKVDPVNMCCFCGQETDAGIYVRHDPKTIQCVCKED